MPYLRMEMAGAGSPSERCAVSTGEHTEFDKIGLAWIVVAVLIVSASGLA